MGLFIGCRDEHREALYIRKKLMIQKPLKKALLKLTALGVVKGYCNGEELDCDLLTPGWVDYRKRIPYYTYDITDRLKAEDNVLAFTLGDGWAVGKIAWFGRRLYGRQPLMWCDIELEYADGTTECIGSDNTFKFSFGQILSNDLFDGEYWDARCDIGDFTAVSYDDSKWQNVLMYSTNAALLEEAINPLTKKKETLSGEYLYERKGYQVYDFAQNHAGVPEIDIRDAKAGTKLTIIYGEILADDGSVFNGNLRSAKAIDTYICRDGKQSFYPHMTFHGYRYLGIQVEGECEFEQVRSRMIYSDISFHSSFECSDTAVTQLYKNIIASQKSNFINVPTDCPQRDERLGWTGDAQVFCRSAMYNADCREFWRKYLIDVIDAQLENGMIDSVAPVIRVDFDSMCGSPAWGDLITILPYDYYCMYQDSSIIEIALPAAKRWVQYCVNDSTSYVRPARGYGDWLSINETTDKAFLGCMYMAYSALLTGKMCEIIGDLEATEYLALYEDIKRTIRSKFMLPGNVLSSDTQTAYVLAYTFGIMTAEEIRPNLLKNLRKHNNHLATGFVGVKYLLPVLCEMGEYDLAYEVFTQKDFPSWCYPVMNGATTMWERWDSYVIGKGFADLGMNSFNHYAFGAVCEWMFSMMLGISYTQDGLTISPVIDESGKITWAKGSHAYGKEQITVEWRNREDGWTELYIHKPEEVAVDLSAYRTVKKISDERYLIKR